MVFPIIEFGANRFLQAHVDVFVSQALTEGEALASKEGAASTHPG